ncbi:5-oxoprolinase subunit PxpB [Paenibacillus humicola]|uniref:5-oxoprolinase subunit PxpB n=1 Tax=Paenibacillus humicola TaxID=3110540 RepID=UPI00237B36F4|nr:5-oxoprolinase subunit PxpB [Paenibacillus humicola]
MNNSSPYQPDDLRTFEIVPLGDSALSVVFGDRIGPETHKRVRQLALYLERQPFHGMIEFVPAFTSVAVYYDVMALLDKHANVAEPRHRQFPFQIAAALMDKIVRQLGSLPVQQAKTVEIPVCYGGEFGPDLETVAEQNGLTPQEVIDIHSGADYLVYMLGFAPGFAYLGGMSERIAAPRRQTPRLAIPAGTVGIAGKQTGVYPIETPGGWQLIGRTPMELFLPKSWPPALLEAGNVVRFYPISRSEFDGWEESRT